MIDPYRCPICHEPIGFARSEAHAAFVVIHPGWPDALFITDLELANAERAWEVAPEKIQAYADVVHAPEPRQN